jgi:pimeloyl-ACP methyl ester carboxylesterase
VNRSERLEQIMRLEALAAKVRVPTLIPWGDQDRNKLRSEADDLQRLIPGSELVRFADSGHYVHEEAAAGVAAAVEGWLARHRIGAPAAPAATAHPEGSGRA